MRPNVDLRELEFSGSDHGGGLVAQTILSMDLRHSAYFKAAQHSGHR